MLKTVKSKIGMIYLGLILCMGIIGFLSTLNLYSTSKSINVLMVDNYKSINAVNNMLEALEDENNAILSYMYIDTQNGIDSFYKNNDKFYNWYNIEFNNLTEPGEKESIQGINTLYLEYIKLFSSLQQMKSTSSNTELNNFYHSKISPSFEEIRVDLKKLSQLNEKAMFNSKTAVTKKSEQSSYFILLISCGAVFFGILISQFYTNKILIPIYSLTETIKSVKEGQLNKQAPILSEDEIGDLAKEFNNMTSRLQQFEQSTLGKLLEEKNKSLTIIKSLSDPLIVLSEDYKIILLNNACESFFDIQEDKVVNKYFLEVIRNAILYDHITESVHCEKEQQKIITLVLHEKKYHFNTIVKIVRKHNKKINSIIVLLQNVTELKQLEKIKTDFLSTISHEFKTPLTSIMMGVSLLSNENIGIVNQKQLDILATIEEDSEKLTDLVNNLLQLSKLQSDNSIYNMNFHSVIGIIQNSIKHFYQQAKNKEINLYYEANEELPKIYGDPEKITWVINNLLSNALKYTNAGDFISIKPYVHKEQMYVEITDSGMGIPEEFEEEIFGKFTQIKSQYTENKGSGLGLAIAKEIIEAHGGTIWCTSKLDEGSTFTFTLPLTNK